MITFIKVVRKTTLSFETRLSKPDSPAALPPLLIYFGEGLVELPRLLQLQCLGVQLEGRPRVVDGVVRLPPLHVVREQVVQEEAKPDAPRPGLVEDLHCVYYLRRGDEDIQLLEVRHQPVTYEDDPSVDQEPKLAAR